MSKVKVKTEFIDELGHLESSNKHRRVESSKNSSSSKSTELDDQSFGEHFLLEGSGMTGDVADPEDPIRTDFDDSKSDNNEDDVDNDDDEDGSGTEDFSGKITLLVLLAFISFYLQIQDAISNRTFNQIILEWDTIFISFI